MRLKHAKGVKLAGCKDTRDQQTSTFFETKRIVLPMRQHIGVPCNPTVQPGDRVLAGQMVGSCGPGLCAPVHSGISGRVERIESIMLPGGQQTQAVVVSNDYAYQTEPSIEPPCIRSADDFFQAVQRSGMVGLGGAGFPTHVKLKYRDIDRLHTLIINGAECEPFITSDYRQCVEGCGEILRGAALVMRYLALRECRVVLEKNAAGAIAAFQAQLRGLTNTKLCLLGARYPKGAEKVAIYEATGITVREGALPADHGVLVMNVSSLAFLARYCETGMPLVERRITVAGNGIAQSGNLLVKIGTPIEEIVRRMGPMEESCEKILMGGPMTGLCVAGLTQPVIKNNNAILFFKRAVDAGSSSCIKCGRCIAACPMRLMPSALEKAYDMRDAQTLQSLKVKLCVNCGCCTYGCPAKRRLAEKNQLAKALLDH